MDLTTHIGTRVVGVLVSKLDGESKMLNLRLRGGMCEVISRVSNCWDQVKFEGELNIDESCM